MVINLTFCSTKDFVSDDLDSEAIATPEIKVEEDSTQPDNTIVEQSAINPSPKSSTTSPDKAKDVLTPLDGAKDTAIKEDPSPVITPTPQDGAADNVTETNAKYLDLIEDNVCLTPTDKIETKQSPEVTTSTTQQATDVITNDVKPAPAVVDAKRSSAEVSVKGNLGIR